MNESNHETAERLHSAGQALMDVDEQAAILKFNEALAEDPEKSESHYNLGLIYKYRQAWDLSLQCNAQAVRYDAENEAANWNLAIAATALNNWNIARECWNRLGVQVPDGEGPIEADFGLTPLRLNPEDQGEVVWGQRLCPVRARICNIPFVESGYHYGDVVLHDGAGTGEREWQGATYAVFNVFQIWAVSGFETHRFQVQNVTEEAMEGLSKRMAEVGAVEDWTHSVRTLCRQCSEGNVHEDCDEELSMPDGERRIAVAVRNTSDLDRITAWAQKYGVKVSGTTAADR